MADCSKWKIWFLMVSAAVGIFVGLAGFCVFSFTFANYQAGFLAGFSGLLSALCLHLHMLKYFSQLAVWYTPVILNRVVVFASVALAAALTLMCWYLVEVISNHQGFYPIETSNPARAVMSFMNVKWAISLLVTAMLYRRGLLQAGFTYQTMPESQYGTSSEA